MTTPVTTTPCDHHPPGSATETGTMRDYMKTLRAQGQLLEVHREVSPKHELAAVTEAVQRTSGKALLFHKVTGTKLPVLTNIYGSRERLAQILLIDPADFCRQWNNLVNLAPPIANPLPMLTRSAYDLIDCRLSDLPLITYAARDGAPYFTSAMFLAKEPETGVANLSFHRSMFISDGELRCRLAPRHHLTLYHEKAEKMGRPLEAAMLIGPPPAAFLSAAAPIPYEADELELAAKLQQTPLPLRRCSHVDLVVPDGTEIVIEGRFLPNERRPEGPFGEFMGYYTPIGPNAVFEVLGVTRRADALFHSINCGSPEEVLTLELSVAANVYQRVSAVLPGVLDVTCQPFVLHTVIKVRQQYEGHARQVLLAALGCEPTWAKVVTVVDEDVNIYDMNDVMWAILTRSRVDRDTIIIADTPTFYRDPHKDHWGRLAIDATAPFARREEFVRKCIPGADKIDLQDYFANR
jgi:UbiD family decarboxylase